jgi:hypothetical protein
MSTPSLLRARRTTVAGRAIPPGIRSNEGADMTQDAFGHDDERASDE